MSSDSIVIQCKEVGKRFPIFERPAQRLMSALTGKTYARKNQFDALRDISFELRKGESVGIIGTNGSGKSTLLHIICGTLTPTTGTAVVKGRVAALLELGAGFNPEFTGRENVFLNGSLMGLKKKQIEERFSSIADFADIGEHIDMPVKTYSSGMYVRLAFAIAAHVDADTLVIDEALSVGDVRFAQKCMRFMRAFRERGTLLFVSHDSGAVTSLCDRAIWLDNGNLRADGAAKDVVEAYLAEQHAKDRADFGESVKSLQDNARTSSKRAPAEYVRDYRQDLIDASSRRSLIEVFEFEEQSGGFGTGGARIAEVALLNEQGHHLTLLLGGENVTLRIRAEAVQNLKDVIVGFYLKDRLGQRIFGDNTYLTQLNSPVNVNQGEIACAEFSFRMPLLQQGSYTFDVAIATGTQDEHTQQAWLHDALVIHGSESSIRGIVGLPMADIKLLVETL
ncbi:ABC transporter ATP-binding protein [Lysobacter sp. HDW10]|nr:ABC transporter ATP-binding protein [Lysobacter sp. HDW10]